MDELFLGIDIGTQGVRAVIAGASGELIAEASRRLAEEPLDLSPGWSEQDPEQWWGKTSVVISEVMRELRRRSIDTGRLKALAVTSTSGTIIPLNKENQPLRRAIMYNDIRATEEANLLNLKGGRLSHKMGYAFNASFSLAKILWIKNHEPEIFSHTARFVHPADYITAKFSGNYALSDTSNVLKTGYDLVEKKWPSFIPGLGIEPSLLPEVKLPGEIIGEVKNEITAELGLPSGTRVCAGATDGVASFFASGAALPGEWNSTLGTTVVVKGVSENMLKDKLGRFYSHLHPQGYWLPGGASSVGGECLRVKFKGKNLSRLDEEAVSYIPSNLIIYPLVGKGERCPFVNSEAEGFMVGKARDKAGLYAGYLEGVGLVEKWIYELIEELGGKVAPEIYTSGGGAKSNIWLKIRASILNKVLIRSAVPEASFGAAILAGSRIAYTDVSQAVKAMVKKDTVIEPEKDWVKIYETKYRKFRQACKALGYE